MISSRVVLRAVVLLLAASLALFAADKRQTENLILVTADGLRWQEVFRGIDPALMTAEAAGMKDLGELRNKLWAESPEERRRLLFPFLWGELARRGALLGNRDTGSPVRVTNRYRVSYPGYSEILTGRAQDEVIQGNDPIQNPTETVLEFLRRRWKLRREQVALFGSWEVFHSIGEHQPGSIFINAGSRALEGVGLSQRLRELSRVQFEVLPPWRSVRHDYFTFEMALEYLKTVRPRVLYITLDETDDWAHDHRYDRVLEMAGYFDQCLRRLWETLQSMPAYRGKTTMLAASDHGRGSTLEDWHGHGDKVAGAEYIWIAAIGPDTPAAGEISSADEYFQRDIAPTLLELAGVDYQEYEGVKGSPIRPFLKP
jgi:Type I phosphodiesterase / nucleotide pyrophosphatase